MASFQRRVFALLLTFFLVNALLWSFSSEALADFAFHEQKHTMLSSEAPNPSDNSGADNQDHGGRTCNHGCHAAIHLQGQISQPLDFVMRGGADAVFDSIVVIFPATQTSRLFRPPRLPS